MQNRTSRQHQPVTNKQLQLKARYNTNLARNQNLTNYGVPDEMTSNSSSTMQAQARNKINLKMS